MPSSPPRSLGALCPDAWRGRWAPPRSRPGSGASTWRFAEPALAPTAAPGHLCWTLSGALLFFLFFPSFYRYLFHSPFHLSLSRSHCSALGCGRARTAATLAQVRPHREAAARVSVRTQRPDETPRGAARSRHHLFLCFQRACSTLDPPASLRCTTHASPPSHEPCNSRARVASSENRSERTKGAARMIESTHRQCIAPPTNRPLSYRSTNDSQFQPIAIVVQSTSCAFFAARRELQLVRRGQRGAFWAARSPHPPALPPSPLLEQRNEIRTPQSSGRGNAERGKRHPRCPRQTAPAAPPLRRLQPPISLRRTHPPPSFPLPATLAAAIVHLAFRLPRALRGPSA